MIVIEEVEGRSEQGVLRPFLCRGDDGLSYVVKGRGAGRSSLIAEFVAGTLGQAFGLPIPSFEIVHVPEQLIAASAVEGIRELGCGLAFASRRLPFVEEFGAAAYRKVDQDLRRKILLFDWWVKNEDRHFTGTQGNPNLLWNLADPGLVVIDHNAAFDDTFDATAFWSGHVFAAEKEIIMDLVFRAEQTATMGAALPAAETALAAIPEEWLWQDAQHTVECDFDFNRARAMLHSFRSAQFWNIFTP